MLDVLDTACDWARAHLAEN
ncbi:hypothetical protein [Kitasatospora cineracea]